MNQKQLDILSGCLLGDGSLVLHKNGRNAFFEYSSSQLEHTQFVYRNFSEFVTDRYKNGPIKEDIFDKRTLKTYTRYSFRTHVMSTLTELHSKWYINRKKIVPKDLALNNTILLYWYIGDGSLTRDSKSKKSSDIKLATNCFSEDDVSYLIGQLSKYHALFRNNEKGQPIIIVKKQYTKTFLEDIGSEYPLCYKHKWDYTEYQNKIPVWVDKKIYEIIQQEFLDGNTIYQLAKKYNVSINGIKRYIKKSNIYKTVPKENRSCNKKCIINGIEYNSIAEASRILKLTHRTVYTRIFSKSNTYKNWKLITKEPTC